MSHQLAPSTIIHRKTEEDHKFLAYHKDHPKGRMFDNKSDDRKDLAKSGWADNLADLHI